jgi:membrane-associated protease RseP (regulator of RpoE activity)
VVVGAHYDHLGRADGAVHPGADDNASGTAVVLELARTFATAGGASRTLVFALFSGEESGLLGSRHYVRHPTVPIERTVAMINLDMVGRLGDRPLGVGGVATGGGLEIVVGDAGRQLGIALADREAPGGASDHAPFYRAGVPVLFFHTGGHPEYHRPTDTADRIDADGLARVAAVCLRVIEGVAGGSRPTYVALPAPPPRSPGAPAPRGVAFLGVSPARAGLPDGVRLGAVVPDGAAARAGMREGDIIVRLGDVPVQSFEELRAALRVRRPGDPVRIVYLRDGDDRTAQAVLGER